MSTDELTFWKAVYVAAIGRSVMPEQALGCADEAVAKYRERAVQFNPFYEPPSTSTRPAQGQEMCRDHVMSAIEAQRHAADMQARACFSASTNFQ